MILRYAIWAAVSTKIQAASDRISIPEQIERCRVEGGARGWNETAGPFVVNGNSRTKYVNIFTAELDMPALREMLDTAQAREFDVLLVYDLNRFRDLLDPIYRALGGYRIQLYSLSQPVEPCEPAKYKWYRSDTMRIVVMMSQLASQTENSVIRRRYEMGMPARVEAGLPAISPPFGYTKPDGRKSIPIQNPETVPYVIQMKDMLLEGKSLRQIADYFNSQHIPTIRGQQWYPQTIKSILTNPFYAGYVRWGLSQVEHDLRAGRRFRNRNLPVDQITTVQGKHKPLWGDATLQAIQDELARRARNYRGRGNNQFTGLLKCSVCGATLWRQGNGPRGAHRIIWRCSASNTHVNIPHVVAVETICVELVRSLQSSTPEIQPDRGNSEAELAEIQQQLNRLEDAYQVGSMKLDSFTKRSNKLRAQIKAIQSREQIEQYRQLYRKQELQAFGDAQERATQLPLWMRESEPTQVNQFLHTLVSSIIVYPDGKVDIDFK